MVEDTGFTFKACSKGVVRQQDGKPKDAFVNLLCILSSS